MEFLLYFLLVFLGYDLPKTAPPNVIELVQKLGDNKYVVRQAAHKELSKYGLSIYRYLEKTAETEKDLEIKKRCRHLIVGRLSVSSDNPDMPVPGIWNLPNEIRFPFGVVEVEKEKDTNGEGDMHHYGRTDESNLEPVFPGIDLAKIYYIMARNQYNREVKRGYELDDTDFRNEDVEIMATKMLIRDILICRRDRKKAAKLLDDMIWCNRNTYFQETYRGYGPSIPPPAKKMDQKPKD